MNEYILGIIIILAYFWISKIEKRVEEQKEEIRKLKNEIYYFKQSVSLTDDDI